HTHTHTHKVNNFPSARSPSILSCSFSSSLFPPPIPSCPSQARYSDIRRPALRLVLASGRRALAYPILLIPLKLSVLFSSNTHTHTHSRTHAHRQTQTQKPTHACTQTNTNTKTHTRMHTHTRVHTLTHTHTHTQRV